jgi:hypothetical protein
MKLERDLELHLAELGATQALARAQWKDLVFLLPEEPDAPDERARLSLWCFKHGIDRKAMAETVFNSRLLSLDYGTTREGFSKAAVHNREFLENYERLHSSEG